MMLSPLLVATLLFLGVIGGLLAGMLGVGGGMFLVPIFTFMLVDQGVPVEHVVHASLATALAVIMFTSLSSMRAHHKSGAILWDVVRRLTPGIFLGGLLGTKLVSHLPTRELALVFVCFVFFSAYQMYVDKKPKPNRTLPQAPVMFGVGTLIGSISSLVGAGGGFISVPFMVWCNISIRNAVATSAALGFPIAVFSSMGYIINGQHVEGMPPGSMGFIYWPAVLCVSVMSVLTAPIGAKLAHRLPVRQIKRAFALLLCAVASSMAYKALVGF